MNTITIVLIATNIITLIALIISYRSQGQNVNIDWTSVPGGKPAGLDPAFATTLIANYKANQWTAANTVAGLSSRTPDSRSVWFDLISVKNFIIDIEATAAQNCKPANAASMKLGIRIYFGAYGGTVDPSTVPTGVDPQSYAHRHTLLMVPTYNDSTLNTNVDFDPNYFNANGTPVSMNNICYTPNSAAKQDLTSTNNTALMLNHGSMVPPPFDPPGEANQGALLL